MKRRAGYSLITVLVATAIVSICLSAVMFIVDRIASSVARNNAEEQIEGFVKTVQGIVMNRDLCNNALRGADNDTEIVFNPPIPAGCGGAPYEQTVEQIVLQKSDNEANATSVLARNTAVGVGYFVENIILRERSCGVGRGQVTIDGVTMNSYAAELEIRFRGDGTQRTVGGMRPRTIPISVVTTPANTVVQCYQDASSEYLCEQLGGSYRNSDGFCRGVLQATDIDCQKLLKDEGPPSSGGRDCEDVPMPAGYECEHLYYVVGFSSDDPARPNARPICKCQKICRFGMTAVGQVSDSTPGATPGSNTGSHGTPSGPSTPGGTSPGTSSN